MKNLPSRELSDKLVEAISELVSARVAEELRLVERVDQNSSPLGRRRHVAAAKRFIEAGVEGAGRAGRRYFLTRSLIDRELARLGSAKLEAVALRERERRELLEELGLTAGDADDD